MNLLKISNMLHGLKPVILLVIAMTMLACVSVTVKLAVADQFNLHVLVAYRFMFSSSIIVPVAIYVEWNKRPKMTRMILFQAFLCGVIGGVVAQTLFAVCVELTSATFVAAATNLVPSVTFIMARIFGLEKVGWKRAAGKAKVLGTLVGLGGAMLLTFYKGPPINIWKTNVDLVTWIQHRRPHNVEAAEHQTNLGLGALAGIGFILANSIWLVIQGKMAKTYPCPYTCTAMTTVVGAVVGTVFGLCIERDWNQWNLGWSIRLFMVAFLGIMGHAMTFGFIAWVVQMRGPLFASSFNPLILILVAIAGSLFLEEQLSLGSVLGAVIIIIGLYMVLWGKNKEMQRMLRLVPVLDTDDVELNDITRAETTTDKDLPVTIVISKDEQKKPEESSSSSNMTSTRRGVAREEMLRAFSI